MAISLRSESCDILLIVLSPLVTAMDCGNAGNAGAIFGGERVRERGIWRKAPTFSPSPLPLPSRERVLRSAALLN